MPAIYVHWPFCVSKCPYCDFNSRAGKSTDQEIWRKAYRKELEGRADLYIDRTVRTIYFGGGTPSLMEPQTVDSVLQDIARLWTIDSNAEITLEANPSSAEAKKFAAFRAAGVNRLSLGIQALNDDALKFLGRAHNAAEAKNALALAAKHFPRYSFDLIYGYADQTLSAWKETLREALPLVQGHISLYSLTVEPRTAFYARAARGERITVSEDTSLAMFEAARDLTTAAGLPPYEVSNHACPGQESRHNMVYWNYEDYIGIGPGAHGRIIARSSPSRFVRVLENHTAPDTWLRQIENLGHGIETDDYIDKQTAMREALMMGLRLSKGIDLARWHEKFGMTLFDFLPAERLNRLINESLIERAETALRTTSQGTQKLDAILSYLLYQSRIAVNRKGTGT